MFENNKFGLEQVHEGQLSIFKSSIEFNFKLHMKFHGHEEIKIGTTDNSLI